MRSYCSAASPRERPSRTGASARSRRTCAPSWLLPAKARRSAAVWSGRVIVRAAPIRYLLGANRRLRRSNQTAGCLGRPRESPSTPVGIKAVAGLLERQRAVDETIDIGGNPFDQGRLIER